MYGILDIVEGVLTSQTFTVSREVTFEDAAASLTWGQFGLGMDDQAYLDARAKRITEQILTAIRTGSLSRMRACYSKTSFFGWIVYLDYVEGFRTLAEPPEPLAELIQKLSAIVKNVVRVTINGVINVLGDILKLLQEVQN